MASTRSFNHQSRHKPKTTTLRKPLQPKNSLLTDSPNTQKSKWIEISLVGDSNKENSPFRTHSIPAPAPAPVPVPLDSSLAEELSAIRKKLERLKLEKEKTEKLLEERGEVLDRAKREIEIRGKAQIGLEMEVQKLIRFKELGSSCLRIQSLRQVEEEKKMPSQSLEPELKSEGNQSENQQSEGGQAVAQLEMQSLLQV